MRIDYLSTQVRQEAEDEVRYGAVLFPSSPIQSELALAATAEELGYSHVWFGDSQLIWREAYVTLGAAALRTRSAILGTAVSNPATRDLSVTASAMATLHELSGGRCVLGIGIGDSALRTLGKKRTTVATLEAAIREIKGLLSGGPVDRDGNEVHLAWAAGAPRPVPIYAGMGAFGYRLLQMSGRVADGCIIAGGVDEGYIDLVWAQLDRGAAEVGRDLKADGFQVVLQVACAVNEDGDLARSWVKPAAARKFVQAMPADFAATLTPSEREAAERIRQEYDYYEHMRAGGKHESIVPDSLMSRFTIAGTPAECREQLARLLQGWRGRVHQLGIYPLSPTPAGRETTLRLFMTEVVRQVEA